MYNLLLFVCCGQKDLAKYKKFAHGQESVVDEEEPGRCVVSMTNATITAVDSLVRSNWRVMG